MSLAAAWRAMSRACRLRACADLREARAALLLPPDFSPGSTPAERAIGCILNAATHRECARGYAQMAEEERERARRAARTVAMTFLARLDPEERAEEVRRLAGGDEDLAEDVHARFAAWEDEQREFANERSMRRFAS